MSRRTGLRMVISLFGALGIASLLLVPTAENWSAKERGVAKVHERMDQRIQRLTELRRVPVAERPGNLSPFGDEFKPGKKALGWKARKGLIETNLGWVDLKRGGAGVLKGVPASLLSEGKGLQKLGGKGRGHGGVNIVQIDAAALADRGYDAIERELRRLGKVLEVVPDRGLVMRVKSKDLADLAALPSVEAIGPYEPAYKVSPLVGRTKLMQRSRARSHTLELLVSTWKDADPGAARADLEAVVGAGKVQSYSLDGSVFLVKALSNQVSRMARSAHVRGISERPEYMLTNSEVPTMLMIGNMEESFAVARPFHDLGIDGGGIDTSGDGRRINNGTDAVPPQIVAVTDNGISVDAVHFSQTATQVTTLVPPAPIGPTHRKVHAIQNVEDGGNSCDSVLSGVHTHGNVVAGIIAGNPGELGFTFTKQVDPQEGPEISGISLDALARGSRIIMQDAGAESRCRINEAVEEGGNVAPGSLLERLNEAICPKVGGTGPCAGITGGADEVHLHVMPFGTPNFDDIDNNPENGTYPLASREVDLFLMNNRDYMVFSPVGSQGDETVEGVVNGVWPDLFNGTAIDEDPNDPARPIQIPPPATAKNVVTVGSTFSDTWTVFPEFNSEEFPTSFTSKGPATAASLRTAPLVMATGIDGVGLWGYPLFAAAATNRSRDNDNVEPVESQVDEGNWGTSFSAGFATAAGAVIRDYFAQGFYPTASRVDADRMPTLSGSLVRAALVASANFLEQFDFVIPPGTGESDLKVANSRSVNLGLVEGVDVGVIGNGLQGYGRMVLNQVLPLANYPPTLGYGAPDTVEYPTPGLLIYDMLGTGEPPIDNSGNTMTEKEFTVDGVNTTLSGGTRVIENGMLRIALSWPDPPSPEDSGGTLINDLDLEVQSPGPDNIYGNADDLVYDGNVYIGGQVLPIGQWSQGRLTTSPAVRDLRNNIEAVHLSTYVSDAIPNQLPTGTWKVRVMLGAGGAIPGQISEINDANEDTNGNGRRDAGETDLDEDGLLDAGGQPFALVIAGPVFAAGAATQTWGGTSHALPASVARFDKYHYTCSDDVTATVFDLDGTESGVQVATIYEVVDDAGTVLDEEIGLGFTETSPGSKLFVDSPVPTRLASPAIKHNGILEGDTGQTIVLRYTDSPRDAEARGIFTCTPNIVGNALTITGSADPPSYVGGGCDGDQHLDADETVSYSVAFWNRERTDDLTDVELSLTATGPGAAAIHVLDSPKNIGRIPGGQNSGVTFSLVVDGATANALPLGDRVVDLVLTLDAKARGVQLSRTSYTFSHVINADDEALHYSTDLPDGGRLVRDYDRDLRIDRADTFDPFQNVFWPDEDVTFSSMFVPGDASARITNTLGEDLNQDGDNTDPGEGDIVPNLVVDGGILVSGVPTDTHEVPWNFDENNGGWFPVRHSDSRPGLIGPTPSWEYVNNGICGFQTAIPDGDPADGFQNSAAGIWHTGDGVPGTPAACENYPYPNDPATGDFYEFTTDVLISPIIAKVNQVNDARGFPYRVEFQRLGLNLNVQTAEYTAGGVDLDNDVDDDLRNSLLGQYRYEGFADIYQLTAFAPRTSYRYGIDPASPANQRTFGPTVDPDGSLSTGGQPDITGDEIGFTGFTQDTNPDSTSPIPTAPPDFLPYPVPGAAVPGVCDGGDNDGGACDPSLGNADCPNGGVCTPAANTTAGPGRNLDIALLDYEDGIIYLSLGPGQGEPTGSFGPGPAGNRWQIGIHFFAQEAYTSTTDYGVGIDDVVLEWDEVHPVDEGGDPACGRFGGPGQPAGQQCATLTVDRLYIYECNESIGVAVNDPRRAGSPSVTVYAVSDSDADLFSTGVVTARHPRKSFAIAEAAGTPGLFKGNVTIGSLFDNDSLLFTTPGDISITFYYLDPECDADGDGAAGENSFSNLDNDGIPNGSDNCDFLYNPLQDDADVDGVGDLCDNCPGVSNADQADADADGVGAACDFNDIDFDGISNSVDNCPDVYNPGQAPGSGGVGAACDALSDRDSDGQNDKLDNCVRTSNATQADSDGDGIGDACDGDCTNPRSELLTTGSCVRTNDVVCTVDLDCPITGHCNLTPTKPCEDNNDCTGGDVCVDLSQETCERLGVVNDGSCGSVNDDLDGDSVPDAIDNCPTVPNPAVIAGTTRQADSDQDGLGDECDPEETVDDDNNGIPDDALTFTSIVACGRLPLARLVVLSSSVYDVGGDGDPFADAGETARMSLTVRNTSSFDLTDATLLLGTTDPDIACITKSTIKVPLIAAGATIDTSTLGSPTGEFEFVVSSTTETTNPALPATGEFFLSATSTEVVGTLTKVSIKTLLDLDLPGGGLPDKVAGPDGIKGTGDDGIIFENFDTDRDLDGVITLDKYPLGTPGVLNDTIGVWVGTASDPTVDVLAGIGCGGFNIPPADPSCIIDPDNDMDWHIHCPAGTCPNEAGHITPSDGDAPLAFSGSNSLHWGHHFDAASRDGDSTKFRQLAAFMTNPINLTPLPAFGDLELSFYHIADMMDANFFNTFPGQAVDFGDVQISLDEDPDPGTDDWGFWDKLVPFQNVYDHIAYMWSTWGSTTTYCLLTPTDTGSAPPAPRGVHETLCYPLGVWSHCGNSRDETTLWQCEGPGYTGTTGPGLWVETKFNLANYLGQRVRIRWIAQSWEFDATSSSYMEIGGTWGPQDGDEGWWIDDIRITGGLEAQAAPQADTKTPGPGTCPSDACDSAQGGNNGFDLVLTVTDEDGDGLFAGGEAAIVSAATTINPGGCVGGGTQYRFFKDSVSDAPVQDWSSDATFIDNPSSDTTYWVQARCSVFPACTSDLAGAGAEAGILVYPGDGADITLSVTAATGPDNISWPSRPQSILVSGYDLYSGLITSAGTLGALGCVSGDIAQPMGAPGPLVTASDSSTPALNTVIYYLAGHSPLATGGVAALGRASDGTLRTLPPVVCP